MISTLSTMISWHSLLVILGTIIVGMAARAIFKIVRGMLTVRRMLRRWQRGAAPQICTGSARFRVSTFIYEGIDLTCALNAWDGDMRRFAAYFETHLPAYTLCAQEDPMVMWMASRVLLVEHHSELFTTYEWIPVECLQRFDTCPESNVSCGEVPQSSQEAS